MKDIKESNSIRIFVKEASPSSDRERHRERPIQFSVVIT